MSSGTKSTVFCARHRAVAPVSKCRDLWDRGQELGDEASISSVERSGLMGASLLLENV